MDIKNFGGIVVGLVLAIILFASILVPTVSSSMVTAGDEVTYTNGEGAKFHLVDGDGLNFSRTYTSADGGFVTINGTTYAQADIGAGGNLVMSDVVTITQNSGGNQCNVYATGATATLFSGSASFTLTASNGAMTITVTGGSTYTYSYTWLTYYDPTGEYSLITGNTANIYVKSINDFRASGLYSSGENDTYYAVRNGSVSGVDGYTSSFSYTLTLVDGTTDVYKIQESVVIGEESFVPYFVLVPSKIIGHEPSGATYELLSIIPLLVVIGIVLGVIGMVLVRRE